MAPAGTPDDHPKLNAAINEGLKSPENQASIAPGSAPSSNPGSPAEFAAFIADSTQVVGVAKAANVRID